MLGGRVGGGEFGLFVVHGCWLRTGAAAEPGRLNIRGDDAAAPATPPPRPGRRPRVRPHPYAVEPDGLIDAGGPVMAGLRQVPALEFDPDLALTVLAELEPGGAALGSSLVHLGELAGFAADLVRRGRVPAPGSVRLG